jgi:hypothetical protein
MDHLGGAHQRDVDRSQREDEAEQAYSSFEKHYLFEHMRPNEIDELTWQLIWKGTDSLTVYSCHKDAVSAAKEMAAHRGVPSQIIARRNFKNELIVLPCDAVEYVQLGPDEFGWKLKFKYYMMRKEFIRDLVMRGMYPDLEAAATEMNHPDVKGIQRHQYSYLIKQHYQLANSPASSNHLADFFIPIEI